MTGYELNLLELGFRPAFSLLMLEHELAIKLRYVLRRQVAA